jgi:hypothetical protein
MLIDTVLGMTYAIYTVYRGVLDKVRTLILGPSAFLKAQNCALMKGYVDSTR